MFENVALRGLVSVLGAFFISLSVGLMYLWGIITIYGTSYFRIVMKDTNLTEDQTDIVFPLTLLGQAISMPFVVRYAKKVSSGMTCFVAGIAMSSVTYLSSYSQSFNFFALLFGLCNGIIIGIIYILPIGHCYQFFPKKKTAISVILIAASGIGTLIFALIAFDCMNFNNLSLIEAGYNGYYGHEIANKFPEFLKILSGVMLGLVSGGGLLLFEFPAKLEGTLKKQMKALNPKHENLAGLMDLQFVLQMEQSKEAHKNPFGNMNYEMDFMGKGFESGKANQGGKVYGERGDYQYWPSINSRDSDYVPPKENQFATNENTNQMNEREPELGNQCPRTRDGPKQSIFWVIFIVISLGTNFGLMISVNYKTFVKSLILDDYYLTMIGSIGAVACGFSRFFWGSMLEGSTFKFLYYVVSIVNAILAFSIYYITFSKQVYFAYVVLAYICYGGHLGMFPAVTSQIFGVRYGPQIYGILFYAFPVSNFIQYLLVNFVEHGYWVIFKISGVMSICALLIVKRIQLKYDWSARLREHNQRKRMMAR